MPKSKTPSSSNENAWDRSKNSVPLTTLSPDSTLNNDQSSIATTSTIPNVYGRAHMIQVPARKPTPKPSNSYTLSKRQFWIMIAVVSVCMVVFVAGTVYLVIDDMKMKGNEAGWRVIPVGGNGTFAENDNTWEVVQVSAGQMRDVGASRGIGGLLLGLDVVVMFI